MLHRHQLPLKDSVCLLFYYEGGVPLYGSLMRMSRTAIPLHGGGLHVIKKSLVSLPGRDSSAISTAYPRRKSACLPCLARRRRRKFQSAAPVLQSSKYGGGGPSIRKLHSRVQEALFQASALRGLHPLKYSEPWPVACGACDRMRLRCSGFDVL